MPQRVCLDPGCSALVDSGRCPEHARIQPNVIRSKEKGRIYDRRRWRILRRTKLSSAPICEECGNALAAEVHHVIPIEDGGDPWVMSNLSSTCKPCHSKITNREVRERSWG
jgi:5-methylcytosine-specific restriction protein A